MNKFTSGLIATILSIVIGFSQASSRASPMIQYGWRTVPSSWRYFSSMGSIPSGMEQSELSPSPMSYRASRETTVQGERTPSVRRSKRDSSFWSYNSMSSSSYASDSDCELTCDGGSCVKAEYRCDGYAQCWDGADEKGCSCDKLIASDKICDGYRDCPDAMDESGCVYGCKSNEFTCDTYNSGSRATCIPLSKRCDGHTDCGIGNDEHDCYRMVDLQEEKPRGVRSQGILQKRVENEWHTVCKTASSHYQIKTYAEKACKHVSGHFDDPIRVKTVSLSNLKKQMSKEQTNGLKYVRMAEKESKFAVLGACLADTVYEIQCPTPQCGGIGNYDNNNRKRRRRDTEDEQFAFQSLEEDEEEEEDTEREGEKGELIVGGEKTEEMQWPFLVGIFRDGEFYCGGSIINERWILTAAHCNHGYEKHTFEVQAGMTRRYSWSPYEQTRHVEEIYVHEGYDQKVFANDIALYKLDQPLYMSKYVTPACLPSGVEDDPKSGQLCKVAGWGDLYESGSGPDHMQEVALPVLDRCQESFTKDKYQICAGVLEGGKDACQGDSGGPLMCTTYDGRSVVNGVVSFGRGCARKDEAGAYTRISAYLDWIESVISGEYNFSSYHPRPKQCSERCHKPGGECLYPEEKCSGKVECLGGEDEIGCMNYITRSHAYQTGSSPPPQYSPYPKKLQQKNQQPPPYYNQGMSRSASAGVNSPSVTYRPYPLPQPIPQPPPPPRGRFTARNLHGRVRKTTAGCFDNEMTCDTQSTAGFTDCIAATSVCDMTQDCPHGSDETECMGTTEDFRQVVTSFPESSSSKEIKGYVMARNQGTEWHPVVLPEWTLEIGQAVCRSIAFSSFGASATVQSMETIQMKDLVQRLRSGVNLMEMTIILSNSAANILALADPMNVQSLRMDGPGLSKTSLGGGSFAEIDDSFILGYVRCQKSEQ